MARKTRRQKQRAAARQASSGRTPLQRTQQWDPDDAASIAGSEPAPEAYSIPTDAGELEADIDAPDDAGDVAAASAKRAPAATARPASASAQAPAPTAAMGAPARRRIERLSQAAPARTARGRAAGNAAAMFQPLESEDAAIPFDRVPYVPADLRRVLVMALLMVVLIIIAAIVVTHVVH